MKKYFIFISLTLPSLAFALSGELKDVIGYAQSLLDLLIPILVGVAFLVFFWGVSKFILNSGNKAEIEKGRNYMLWSILALFIMITYKTIITYVSSDFEFGGKGTVVPQLNITE